MEQQREPVLPISSRDGREQAEWLRITLTSIGDAVIATDTDGNVTFLNPVAEALTGWTQAEAAGTPLTTVFRIVNESTRREVENPALRALREGVIVGLANHTVLIARDGTERPIDDSAAPIRDGGGAIGGAVLVFRDITERKRAEVAQARLAAIVESSDDAIVSKTLDGVITSWNAGAERIFGYSPAEAIGKSITMLIPEERLDEEVAILDRVRRGLRVEPFETVRVAKGGRRVDISLTVSPIRDAHGQVIGASKIARDVTARKAAERALEESRAAAAEQQARLAAIVESSDDAIVSKDLDGVIRSWNTGAERIFGWTAAEAVGKSITLIIPPERLNEEHDIIGRIRRGERVDHFETVRVAKDGRRLDISLTVSPVRGADGRVVGASKVARDVTERRRLEAVAWEERRTVETLNAIGTRLAAELDLGKLLQAVTDESVALTGAAFGAFFYNATGPGGDAYTLYALSGAPRAAFEKFPHPRSTAVFEPTFTGRATVRLDDVTADPRYGQNLPYHGMPEGHLPVRSYLAVPVRSRSGEVLGGLFFGHSQAGVFTARHERLVEGVAAQAAVAVDNARLYESLRDQDRKKDDFIALLAHELRNPLAPIRNGLQVVRLSADRAVRERSQAMMDRQLAHMVRMIDDLLDVSRIGRHKMELRPARVGLAEVVGSAVEAARPAVDEAGHELAVTLPASPVLLDADLTRLSQVFSNLLTNSAKYTPRGGRIWLTAERTNGHVVVSVRDTGIGIPKDALPTIFDMFSQVGRSVEKSTGGLGIGLALVKGLVEMHGGTVAAASEGEDQGSTFIVTLPVLSAVAAEHEPDETTSVPTGGRRVLVVDDNRDGAESLADMLGLLGHEVATAHDGLEAVERAGAFRPDVILMDVGMPRLNGLDATRRIREESWGRTIKVVALTGWGQDHDREKSRAAGCDAHLVKPVDFADLQRVLAEVAD